MTARLFQNRLLRRNVAPGIDAFIYDYANATTLRVPPMVSSGFEIDLALTGTWRHWGAASGRRDYGGAEPCLISPAERYQYDVRAVGGPGRQVGLMIYPAENGALSELASSVFSPGRSPAMSARMVELLHAIADGPLDAQEVTAEVARFIGAHARPHPHDALLEAKLELERTFDRPLYRQHLADVAGMHPTTFSRHFARRFGLTPIHYRHELRINAAVRMLWSRPDLAVEHIADSVGFNDRSYFHRIFVGRFGVTAAEMRRQRST